MTVARISCSTLKHFREHYSDCVTRHIPHKHSVESSTRAEVVCMLIKLVVSILSGWLYCWFGCWSLDETFCCWLPGHHPLNDSLGGSSTAHGKKITIGLEVSIDWSVRLNLGIIRENPSTTAGAISILERLHDFVPCKPDGTPYKKCLWFVGLYGPAFFGV